MDAVYGCRPDTRDLETGPRASNSISSLRTILYESFVLVADRKANFKASAFAWLANNQNLTFVARDDAVRGRKTEATSEFSFGGKKRFEDS